MAYLAVVERRVRPGMAGTYVAVLREAIESASASTRRRATVYAARAEPDRLLALSEFPSREDVGLEVSRMRPELLERFRSVLAADQPPVGSWNGFVPERSMVNHALRSTLATARRWRMAPSDAAVFRSWAAERADDLLGVRGLVSLRTYAGADDPSEGLSLAEYTDSEARAAFLAVLARHPSPVTPTESYGFDAVPLYAWDRWDGHR